MRLYGIELKPTSLVGVYPSVVPPSFLNYWKPSFSPAILDAFILSVFSFSSFDIPCEASRVWKHCVCACVCVCARACATESKGNRFSRSDCSPNIRTLQTFRAFTVLTMWVYRRRRQVCPPPLFPFRFIGLVDPLYLEGAEVNGMVWKAQVGFIQPPPPRSFCPFLIPLHLFFLPPDQICLLQDTTTLASSTFTRCLG